jgi:hypothetical protein
MVYPSLVDDGFLDLVYKHLIERIPLVSGELRLSKEYVNDLLLPIEVDCLIGCDKVLHVEHPVFID